MTTHQHTFIYFGESGNILATCSGIFSHNMVPFSYTFFETLL